MKRVALIFAPQCEPFQPYASLPYLAGFLRGHGVEVHCIDANVESFHHLFRRETMASFASRVQARYADLREHEHGAVDELAALDRPALAADAIVEGVDDAREALCSWRGVQDYPIYARSWRLVQEGFRLISAAHYPTSIAVNMYGPTSGVGSMRELHEASDRHEQCVFSPFFAESVVPRIEALQPDLVGLSVISEGQVIPSFVLASMLRAHFGRSFHLTIGGTFFSRFEEELVADPALFEIADSFVVDEGERALLELVEAAPGGPQQPVPNTLFTQEGRVVAGPDRVEPYDELPPPDFGGLPLDLYVAPEPIYPLHQSRGCYWGRCTFCNHRGLKSHETYRPRSPRHLYEDVVALVERHEMRFFTLWDEATAPAALRELCQLLIDDGRDLSWRCVARFEGHFTTELCRLMAQAGCRGILFGFESGCARVLDDMRKGGSIETTEQVLANCRAAGISTYLSAMVGYPSETLAEARETASFVSRNRDSIDHVALSTFELARGSTIATDPEAFGIAAVEPGPPGDLRHYCPFMAGKGMSRWEAAHAHEELFKQFDSLGVSAYNLIYSGPHLLFFSEAHDARELAQMGLRERTPRDETPADVLARSPRLEESVLLSARGTCAIDRATFRTLRLTDELLRLLKLCDGTRTTRELIDSFAQQTNRARADVAESVTRSIKSLHTRGVIDLDGGAGSEH